MNHHDVFSITSSTRKKRIMSGTSIPSYRHYFKDRNLSKIWPPEKEPLLTKAPSRRSLKK
jgi:hypothetical protein